MNYREIYEEGKETLRKAEISEAELDARLLLEYVCGTDRNTLLVHGGREVADRERLCYLQLIRRRASRAPLQYLTGSQEFMGLEFHVNEKTLIPRQDTEILVEEALRNLHDGMRVLDLCTGCGCILISLLSFSNNCRGVGVDISREALEIAEENARRLLGGEAFAADEGSCPEGGRSVSFLQGDLFENLEEKFDMIVSNPPYIRTAELESLMPEVREHEPVLALDGGSDGLLFYRRILEGCKGCLMKGGMLLFEIGYDQGKDVAELMERTGFLEIQVVKDYGGQDRVVCGTLGFEG